AAHRQEDRRLARFRRGDDRLGDLQVVGVERADSIPAAHRFVEQRLSRDQHDYPFLLKRRIASATEFGWPTLPGKTTYGIPGNLLSSPNSHPGTPGNNWPNTIARRTPSPRVAVSLDVMPPFAIKN